MTKRQWVEANFFLINIFHSDKNELSHIYFEQSYMGWYSVLRKILLKRYVVQPIIFVMENFDQKKIRFNPYSLFKNFNQETILFNPYCPSTKFWPKDNTVQSREYFIKILMNRRYGSIYVLFLGNCVRSNSSIHVAFP